MTGRNCTKFRATKFLIDSLEGSSRVSQSSKLQKTLRQEDPQGPRSTSPAGLSYAMPTMRWRSAPVWRAGVSGGAEGCNHESQERIVCVYEEAVEVVLSPMEAGEGCSGTKKMFAQSVSDKAAHHRTLLCNTLRCRQSRQKWANTEGGGRGATRWQGNPRLSEQKAQ